MQGGRSRLCHRHRGEAASREEKGQQHARVGRRLPPAAVWMRGSAARGRRVQDANAMPCGEGGAARGGRGSVMPPRGRVGSQRPVRRARGGYGGIRGGAWGMWAKAEGAARGGEVEEREATREV